MSSFCSHCANEMGFEVDYDIDKIFKSLKLGYFQSCLCEGCGLTAILKTEDGQLKLISHSLKDFITKEEYEKQIWNN